MVLALTFHLNQKTSPLLEGVPKKASLATFNLLLTIAHQILVSALNKYKSEPTITFF